MNRIACFIIAGLINLLLITTLNLYLYSFIAIFLNTIFLNIINEKIIGTKLTYQDENDNIVCIYFKTIEDKIEFLKQQGLL